MLIKFNFLNIFTNLFINKLFVVIPYYLFKFKLKMNFINLYKICLFLFNKRLVLNDIKFKLIFKVKFILFKFMLFINKFMLY